MICEYRACASGVHAESYTCLLKMDINSFQAGVTIGLNVSSGVTGGVLAVAG